MRNAHRLPRQVSNLPHIHLAPVERFVLLSISEVKAQVIHGLHSFDIYRFLVREHARVNSVLVLFRQVVLRDGIIFFSVRLRAHRVKISRSRRGAR